MGADKNGDESCNGMVSGGNTVLRRSGVCPGENTGVIQNEKQPGYGHIKWADTPKMKSISQAATTDKNTY